MSVRGITRATGKELQRLTNFLSDIDSAIRVANVNFLSATRSLGEFHSGLKNIIGLLRPGIEGMKLQVGGIWDMREAFEYTSRVLPNLYNELWNLIQTLGYTKAAQTKTYQNLRSLIDGLLQFKEQLMGTYGPLRRLTKRTAQFRAISFKLLGAMFGLAAISKVYKKTVMSLVTLSWEWSLYMDDVSLILADIADLFAEPLEPVLFEPLVGVLETVYGWVEKLPPELRGAIGVLILGGGVALDVATFFGQLGVAIFGIIAGLGTLAETFPVLAGPISKVIGLINKILGAIANLIGKFIELGSTIFGYIKTAGKAIVDFFSNLLTSIYTKIVPALTFLRANWISLGIGVAAALASFLIIDQLLSGLPAQLRGPIGALVALTSAVIAAAVAWMAFHGTMTLGVAIPAILTAVGIGIAAVKAMASMENLTRPVEIAKPTAVFLHPGEEVHPKRRAGGYQPKEPPLAITVDITGVSSLEEALRTVSEETARQVSDYQERKYRRSEY